jgi:hypothetical protein
VQAEILEGLEEATKVPEDENGVKGFDDTRRRLGRGCFMNGEEVGEMKRPGRPHDTMLQLGMTKSLLHRTGIEPVPLAWKASMITTSPSVLMILSNNTLHVLKNCLQWTPARLCRVITLNPSQSCLFKTSVKVHCVSQRIIQRDTQTYRPRFARPLPTIHGAPLVHR